MDSVNQPAATQVAAVPEEASRPPAYRWVILVICWLAYTLIYVNRTAWSVVAVDASHSLGLTIAELGVFATALSIGYVVTNMPGGMLADLIGGRLAVGISLALAGILTIVFGTITSLGEGIALQIVIGLVSGADVASFTKLLSRWFPVRERGTAFGLYITSTALGGVIANATIPSLLAHLDWNGVYYVLGALLVVMAVICWTFLRNSPPGEPPVAPTLRQPAARAGRFGVTGMIRNRNLMALTLGGLGLQWATLGFLAWGNSLMVKAYGLSTGKAALVMVIVSTTAIGVKPLIGFLSDRLHGGRKVHLMILSGYFVIILVVFGLVGSYGGMLAVAPLMGLGVYGYTALTNLAVPQYADPRYVGGAFGFANTFWQLGGVFAPIAVGAAYSASGSFFLACAVLAVGPFLSIFCLLPIRERRSPAATG